MREIGIRRGEKASLLPKVLEEDFFGLFIYIVCGEYHHLCGEAEVFFDISEKVLKWVR